MDAQEKLIDMNFAKAGIDMSQAFWKQPPHADPSDQTGQSYLRSTPVGVNVRAYEQGQDRARGGTRGGLKRYVATALVPGWIVQHVAEVVTVGG